MRYQIFRLYFICLIAYVLAYPTGAAFASADSQSEASQVITNPKDPVPSKGDRKRIVFREELTIGVEEGDENYMFGDGVSVTVDDSGCFFVLDWDQKRIQKYDPKGRYLCSIGREGQGPGEFRNIWDMRFDAEGHIYATDIANKRVSFFSKEDGQYKKQIHLGLGMNSIILLPNGNYFSMQSTDSDEVEGRRRVDYEYGIFDPEYTLLHKFQEDFYQSPPMRGGGNRAEFLAELMSNSAFKPAVSYVVLENGRIFIGKSDEYSIKEYGQEGNLIQEILREVKQRKVDSVHKDFFFEHQVTTFLSRSPGGGAEMLDEVRKQMKYPKNLPYFFRFQVMDNGWLFVIEDMLADKAMVDLFDEEGVYVGRFETEVPVITMSFRNGNAYTVTVFDDYKFVKRYGYSIEKY